MKDMDSLKESIIDHVFKEYNPYHDKLGKFASVSSKGFSIEGTTYQKVTPKEFIKYRDKMPKEFKIFLSQYSNREFKKYKDKLYLATNKQSGFALRNKDEIINLFSLKKGEGQKALTIAIELGGRRLDCLDKKGSSNLPKYYNRAGFKEIKREKNWTSGEPDVIFMRIGD